jgi:hypothetical protein
MLDLEAASVADLELWKWEGAETAITVEAECIFQICASGIGGTAFVVGDGDFFPRIDVTDCVDGFTFCAAVPTIVSIWKTTMINEANGRIDATNHGVGTAGQSVGFDNAAERVFAREIVMKHKELSLLGL